MNILIGMILIFLVGYFYGYVAGLDRNINSDQNMLTSTQKEADE